MPRHATASFYARQFGQMLTQNDQGWIVNLLKWANVHALFGNRQYVPPMTTDIQVRLKALYQPEIEKIERLLGREITAWH